MGENLDRLNENLAKMEELSRRLVAAMGRREPGDMGLEGPGQDLYMKAGMAYLNEMMTNPAKLMELFGEPQEGLLPLMEKVCAAALADAAPKDSPA